MTICICRRHHTGQMRNWNTIAVLFVLTRFFTFSRSWDGFPRRFCFEIDMRSSSHSPEMDVFAFYRSELMDSHFLSREWWIDTNEQISHKPYRKRSTMIANTNEEMEPNSSVLMVLSIQQLLLNESMWISTRYYHLRHHVMGLKNRVSLASIIRTIISFIT